MHFLIGPRFHCEFLRLIFSYTFFLRRTFLKIRSITEGFFEEFAGVFGYAQGV